MSLPAEPPFLKAIKAAVSKKTQVTLFAGRHGSGRRLRWESSSLANGPYAEGVGDRSDLSLDKEDLAAIANVKKAGIPVVVILIAGRPMIIGEALPQADAFVAAFLPGTEGQGIADVLFGDYKPTGKLSFSWPKSMDQLPLNANGPKDRYDPSVPPRLWAHLLKSSHGLHEFHRKNICCVIRVIRGGMFTETRY